MRTSLAVGLGMLSFMGCSTAATQVVETQAELVEEGPPLEAVAPEQMDVLREPSPDLAVEPVGLSPIRDERRYVAPAPADLMTATGLAPLLLFGPEAGDLLELIRRDPDRAHVVRHPEGDVIDRGLEDGSQGYGDITTRLEFVLGEPLEDRWYAIEIDLPESVVGSIRTERGYIARFRPDSHPIVRSVLTGDREGRRVLDLRFSERVEGVSTAAEWRINDALGELPCEIFGPEPGRQEHHAVFVCLRQESGRVEIDLGGPLTTVLGTSLQGSHEHVLSTIAGVHPHGTTLFSGSWDQGKSLRPGRSMPQSAS